MDLIFDQSWKHLLFLLCFFCCCCLTEHKGTRRDFRNYDKPWQLNAKKPKKSKSDLAVSNIYPPSPESKSCKEICHLNINLMYVKCVLVKWRKCKNWSQFFFWYLCLLILMNFTFVLALTYILKHMWLI